MQLSIAQGLATILNIQIITNPLEGEPQIFAVVRNGIELPLGLVTEMSLDQAVTKAVSETDLMSKSEFAVFPLKSNRADYYMAIERELLRQEEIEGRGPLWKQVGSNPQEVVTLLMTQMRELAVNVAHPQGYQQAMLQVSCLVVMAFEWTSAWIAKIKIEHAARTTRFAGVDIGRPGAPVATLQQPSVSEGKDGK